MKSEDPAILIVDDEIDILRLFKEVFEIRGWRVFSAPTGLAAMSILEKEKISVMLLDIKLPGASGIEILSQITSKYPTLPIIMVTALGYEDELVNKAFRLGASGYISKTAPIRELIEAIKNVTSRPA